MARPTKPKVIKQAQGTLKKSRDVISLNLQPLTELPKPPEEFNYNEAWFFTTVCEALFNSNMLRSADLMTIESMAGWWSIMKESQKDIRDNGMVQVAERTGWRNPSPSIQIFEKAWNKLKDFSDRYGFNLLSKDKISAPVKKGNDAWLDRKLKK